MTVFGLKAFSRGRQQRIPWSQLCDGHTGRVLSGSTKERSGCHSHSWGDHGRWSTPMSSSGHSLPGLQVLKSRLQWVWNKDIRVTSHKKVSCSLEVHLQWQHSPSKHGSWCAALRTDIQRGSATSPMRRVRVAPAFPCTLWQRDPMKCPTRHGNKSGSKSMQHVWLAHILSPTMPLPH